MGDGARLVDSEPAGLGEVFQEPHRSGAPCTAIFERFNGASQCFQLFHLESARLIRPGGKAAGVFERVLEIGGVAASAGV
jgi:hypothetical protein